MDAKELYKGKDFNWGFYDYEPIINSLGDEVVIQVDDRDYQGDSRVLYKNKDGKIGILIFGWGSCSGCDALQACGSYDDVDELIEDLRNDIKWFDNKSAALKYVNEKDWELDFSWHYDETKQFVEKVKKYLGDKHG